MTVQKFLADISRGFLEERKVLRYKMKKTADMTDDEVITACHFYCESNNLNEEWMKYRYGREMQYNYCPYLEEYIENELCINMQMIADGAVGTLTEIYPKNMDVESLNKHCNECINRLPF